MDKKLFNKEFCYSNERFEKYFGRKIRKNMIIQIVIGAILLLVFLLTKNSILTSNDVLSVVRGLICFVGVSCLFTSPVHLLRNTTMKKQAEWQKLFIEEGVLHAVLFSVFNINIKKFDCKSSHYVFDKITDVKLEGSYLKISGNIAHHQECKGMDMHTYVDSCKIPMCFADFGELLDFIKGKMEENKNG